MQHRLTTLLLVGFAFTAGACDDDDPPTQSPQFAQVRVINASAGTTGNVDLFSGTTRLTTASGLGFRNSACVAVPVGNRTLAFRSGSTDIATTSGFNFQAGQRYTVVLYGTGTTRTAAVLSDPAFDFTAPANNNALRFLNATSAAGDIHVTTPGGTLGTPGVANLAVNAASTGGTSGFLNFPVANTQVRLFNVGTTTGNPRVTFDVGTLTGNRARTIVLTEGNPGAFAVEACPQA